MISPKHHHKHNFIGEPLTVGAANLMTYRDEKRQEYWPEFYRCSCGAGKLQMIPRKPVKPTYVAKEIKHDE